MSLFERLASGDMGRAAEDRAARHLEMLGYQLLERRYRTRLGEVDIIARDGATIVFVEVKARTRPGFGGPASAVTAAKRSRLAKTAATYLQARHLWSAAVRFDVLSILDGKLEHLKDAFASPLRFTI